MSSVGEGLAAIGQGLLDLENRWRSDAERKIGIVLQQAGGDWTAAAPIIQSDPNLRKAFRRAYGVDFDANKILKSTKQKMEDLALSEKEADFSTKQAARGFYNQTTNAGIADLATDPSSKGAVGNKVIDISMLSPEEQRQRARISSNVALDPNESIRIVRTILDTYGTLEGVSPEVLKAAGINWSPQIPQNQAISDVSNLMQMNPMTAAFGQQMGGGVDALAQAAQNLFGGGGQPQGMGPGTLAYRNMTLERLGERRNETTERGQDIRERLGGRSLDIRQQQADTAAKVAAARINKINADITKIQKAENGVIQGMSPGDRLIYNKRMAPYQYKLQSARDKETNADRVKKDNPKLGEQMEKEAKAEWDLAVKEYNQKLQEFMPRGSSEDDPLGLLPSGQ